jgi:hypothetical protein
MTCSCTSVAAARMTTAIVGPNEPAPGGITDGGRVKTRWVCPHCGICLCGGVKIGTEPPGYARIVRGGTLDDTSWLKPTTHFYTRSKQPWVILPEGATIYETQPNLSTASG